MKLIFIDTHIWIKFINRDKKLPKEIIQAVTEASDRYTLALSSVSVWELALLVRKKHISLNCGVENWVASALQLPGLTEYPLDAKIALESEQLPGVFHGDPADRFIVATARVNKAALVTMDKKIMAYAKQGYIEVIA